MDFVGTSSSSSFYPQCLVHSVGVEWAPCRLEWGGGCPLKECISWEATALSDWIIDHLPRGIWPLKSKNCILRFFISSLYPPPIYSVSCSSQANVGQGHRCQLPYHIFLKNKDFWIKEVGLGKVFQFASIPKGKMNTYFIRLLSRLSKITYVNGSSPCLIPGW